LRMWRSLEDLDFTKQKESKNVRIECIARVSKGTDRPTIVFFTGKVGGSPTPRTISTRLNSLKFRSF
jgi:hypothetical protein